MNNNSVLEFDIVSWLVPYTLSSIFIGLYASELFLFPLLSGIILLTIFAYLYTKVHFSKKWIKIQGRYKKYNLHHIRYIGMFNNYSYDSCYRPYCLYMYEVDGKTYKNDRLCILNKDFLTHEQFKKNAHYIVGKNSRTKEVDVYYNPQKPNESILVKGASSSKMIVLYSMFAIGLVSLAIGLYNCPCI